MDMDLLAKKLQMIGKQVVKYNQFSIIYRQNGDKILEKYTINDETGEITKEVITSGISFHAIGEHFLLASSNTLGDWVKVYVKNKKGDIASDVMIHEIYHSNGEFTLSKSESPRDSEVILCDCYSNDLVLINYKGSIIYIGSNRDCRNRIIDKLFVEYSKSKKLYLIGYCAVITEGISGVSSVIGEQVLAQTDKDFNNLVIYDKSKLGNI